MIDRFRLLFNVTPTYLTLFSPAKSTSEIVWMRGETAVNTAGTHVVGTQ